MRYVFFGVEHGTTGHKIKIKNLAIREFEQTTYNFTTT